MSPRPSPTPPRSPGGRRPQRPKRSWPSSATKRSEPDMRAVHIGAGNIGRGFVGLLLHEAGYELVFSDVAEDLIASLQAAGSYTVRTVGQTPSSKIVDGFRSEDRRVGKGRAG